jgi:hypothetical protein
MPGAGELSRKADEYCRTINEAQLQGYTGLRVTCDCGRIVVGEELQHEQPNQNEREPTRPEDWRAGTGFGCLRLFASSWFTRSIFIVLLAPPFRTVAFY